jgi:heptosyltransferase-2
MEKENRFLIRSPNWLGDAVMAIPALQAWINHRGSELPLAVVAPANLAPLWQHIPGIDAVFIADRNPFITASEVTPWHADGMLILPNSPRTALESYLAGIPQRFGFTGKWRKFLLTHTFDRPGQKGPLHHQSLDILDLLKAFDLVPEETILPQPDVPRPARHPAMKEEYLLICPGAEYGSAKCWPAGRYAKTINAVATSEGLNVILAGGENDQAVCASVAEELTVPHQNLAGQTSLAEFLSLCAHTQLILCNDSGAMHAASLFNTPGVALFGSTEPAWTGPITDSITVLQEDVPCSPCFLRECYIDFRCMNQLSVDRVLATCLQRLNH